MDYRDFIQLDLPVAVAIVSCGADWRVEEANAEFTDVLGYTEKELRETRPQKMVYDEDYAILVSVLENVVRTHDNGKMQLRIVRPDGKTRWVEMRCSVLAHYDVKPYVVLFLWDIDEEKRREEHQKLLNQKYELMEQLFPHLSEGDILIDGGNSNYEDTNRRVALAEKKGFRFVGAGVSGGEEGALNGASIMPGGSESAWPEVKPILQSIAA